MNDFYDNKIINCNDMIMRAGNISMSTIQNANDIISVWKKVVSNVHSKKFESEDSDKRIPLGSRLADNTRVIDLKNGVLLVETDHPGWIQYLKIYQKFIVTGLKMHLPSIKINSLAFRISGSNANLSDAYEEQLSKSRNQMEKEFEKQEKELEKFNTPTKESGNSLPPDLLAKFDSIRESMLTNSENK